MSDFITISCPSCGGILTRAQNATTYICDYCGQSHRLRMEDVEEFGRCPICRRNDRVEIVRAIYNKGGNLAKRLAPPAALKETNLYQPPPKPELLEKPIADIEKNKFSKIGYILIMFSTLLIFLSYFIIGDRPTTLFGSFFIILLVIGLATVDKGENLEKQSKERQQRITAEWKEKNKKRENDWVKALKEYDKFIMSKYNHSRALTLYDQLYYCHRDDAVFIPGKSGHAPSDQLENFLYQKSTEE